MRVPDGSVGNGQVRASDHSFVINPDDPRLFASIDSAPRSLSFDAYVISLIPKQPGFSGLGRLFRLELRMKKGL